MKRFLARLGFCAGITALAAAVSFIRSTTATPLAFSSQACHYAAGGALPDPSCTPGATNPAVTQQTIGQTICVKGWTKTIRPDPSVTGPEKLASMNQYGVSDPANYEYDHLISLELGGAPNDTRNLWPEPHHIAVAGIDQGSFAKDVFETGLKLEICGRKAPTVTLAAAQYWIAHDWRKITLGKPLPPIPTTTTTTNASASCTRWPGRHYFHHVYHPTCKANYATSP